MTPDRTTLHKLLAACVLAVALPVAAQAQGTTKDIVLDRIHRPATAVTAAAPASDAMAVSVLLESPNGTLRPRPTSAMFRTGDRFRVKLLAARDGKISLYNTRPDGQLNPQPVWQGGVRRGQELVTPRLRLDGMRGTDQLHILLEPTQTSTVVAWLTGFLSGTAKDIRLDTQDTPTTTYLLGGNGKGLVTTLRITHR